ncbi:MAG: hypothetical protein WD690_06725 [Vicinamibacterales bacterium]
MRESFPRSGFVSPHARNAEASGETGLSDYAGLAERDPALIAGVLYRDFSRDRDDVTIVVARRTGDR